MGRLFQKPQVSAYRDRRFQGSQSDFDAALHSSTTVYLGNLSFYTTEEQVHELFSRAGEVRRIVMGLDKNTMTPCGFCFVMFYSREDTEAAVRYLSGTILDDRPIRVDFDWGFQDGRQWGRGRSGGQVRDEYRTDYDPGRGGYGKLVQQELVQGGGGGGNAGGGGGGGGPPRVQPLGGRHRQQQQQQQRHRGRGGARISRPFSSNPPESGRKRGREEEGGVDGAVVAVQDAVAAAGSKDANPRFRERKEDSDEEA